MRADAGRVRMVATKAWKADASTSEPFDRGEVCGSWRRTMTPIDAHIRNNGSGLTYLTLDVASKLSPVLELEALGPHRSPESREEQGKDD